MKKEKVLKVLEETKKAIENKALVGLCMSLDIALIGLNKSSYIEDEFDFIMDMAAEKYKAMYKKYPKIATWWWPYKAIEPRVNFLNELIKDIKSGKIEI